MNAQALWYFEGIDLFGKLCPLKKDKNSATAHPKSFKAGETIYILKEKANHLHVIVKGRVKIGRYLEDGKEVTKSILGEGEVFGEMALAGQTERKEFAEALDHDTKICMLRIDEIKQLMLVDNDMNLKVLKWMGLRIQKLERNIEMLAFKDARTRIVEFLKDAAEWKGKPIGHEILIKTKLTHGEIAKLTATSRQTVSEVMNLLRTEDRIYFERGKILIRDMKSIK